MDEWFPYHYCKNNKKEKTKNPEKKKNNNKYIRKTIAKIPGDIPVVGASLVNDCIYEHVTPLSENDIIDEPSVSFNKDNAKGSRAFFRDYPYVMDRHHIAIIPNKERVDAKYFQTYLDLVLSSNNYGWGENVATVEAVQEFTIPIPKAYNEWTSLEIQKALVVFLEVHLQRFWGFYHISIGAVPLMQKYERCIVPNTFNKLQDARNLFDKWARFTKIYI